VCRILSGGFQPAKGELDYLKNLKMGSEVFHFLITGISRSADQPQKYSKSKPAAKAGANFRQNSGIYAGLKL
jgi:hypothetical protein